MSQYKLTEELYTKITVFLKSNPVSEVEALLPAFTKLADAPEKIFEQDELVPALNYMVNKPYFLVFDVLNKVFPLLPVEQQEEVRVVEPEVVATPAETSLPTT